MHFLFYEEVAAFQALGFQVIAPNLVAAVDFGMWTSGTPIGSDEFLAATLVARLDKGLYLLQRLRTAVDLRMPSKIPTKAGLFYTARLCVFAPINFTLRTVCCSVTIPFAQRLTEAIQNFFLCLIDRTDLGELNAWPTERARELFRLRLFLANRHGGMGLIDSAQAAPAAMLGNLRQMASFLQTPTGGLFNSEEAIETLLPELSRAVTAFQQLGGELPTDYTASPSFFGQGPRAPPANSIERHRNPQAELMDRLSVVALRRLEVLVPPMPRTPERLGLVSSIRAHAGSCFNHSPVGHGMGLRNEMFRMQGCLRLGLPPTLLWTRLPRAGRFKCPHFGSCKRWITWDDGHWLTCTGITHNRQHRMIQQALAEVGALVRRATAIRIDDLGWGFFSSIVFSDFPQRLTLRHLTLSRRWLCSTIKCET